MPSKFLRHEACPKEDCGSSDAFAIYSNDDGTTSGYCFSCNHHELDIYKVLGRDEIDTTYLESIEKLPILGLDNRGIAQWAVNHFGTRSELSTSDGKTVVANYHPYTRGGKVVAYKVRKLPKDITCVGDFKNLELFGQSRCDGTKKLFITEGEEDAIALFQVLKQRNANTQWAYLNPCVVSICSGSSSAVKDITRNLSFVKGFEQVILVFDQDKPGQDAVEEVLKLLPEALVAKFDEKDCNDMLLKGKSDQLFKAVMFNASKHKPSSVVTVDEVFNRAISKPTIGLSWPWPTLTNQTYGIHTKKLYGLGAGVGLGKSEFSKTLAAHLVYEHGERVGQFAFEEDVGRTLKGIAGKHYKKLYHDPTIEYSDNEIKEAITSLKEKVFLYDHFGCRDWDDIKSAIRYMVVGEGIKYIYLDPLTALVSHLTSGEANDMLNTIMGDLAGMTHELDFSVFYFCHLNPPQAGPPHERGGKVVEQQFTGSRAMMKWSHYIFGLEGNRDPELPVIERNTRYLSILKDREYGRSCRFPILYNSETGEFKEPIFTGAY